MAHGILAIATDGRTMEVWTDRQQNVPTRQHNRTDPRGRSHTILTSPGAQHLSIQHLQGKQTLPAPTTHQTCDLSSLTPPTKHMDARSRSWMVSWFKKKTKNTPLDGDHTYCTHHYTQIDIVPIRSCHEALVCCPLLSKYHFYSYDTSSRGATVKGGETLL